MEVSDSSEEHTASIFSMIKYDVDVRGGTAR
jgi:hypothetical protein